MKKQILLFSVMSFVAGAVYATGPLKDAACASKLNLKTPEGSSGVYFDEDCKTAFVLPPAMSDVQITSIAGTMHARKCEAFNILMSIQEKNAETLEKLLAGNEKDEPVNSGTGSELDNLLDEDEELDPDELQTRLELMDQYLALTQKTEQLFDQFKDEPAASATVGFTLPWDGLVNKYAQMNSNTGIRFVRMPLTAAYLTFNRAISKVGTAPAIIDYDIPGLSAKGAEPSTSNSSTLLVGDAYSGQIMLSLVGACPFYRKSTKSLATQVSGNSLTAYLNANLNYNFDLKVYRKYTVTYNLGLLVKRIHKRSSSGGFFSTKSHVTEINDSKATDWFKLDNDSNDSRFNYELLVPEVKADMMNRAIRDITMMAGFNPENAPQVVARTKNGAQASAEALQKCPNQYCQIAAIGLQALDAIFGSSKATSTYINERNADVKDEVNDNKMISFSGSSIFVPEKRVW